MAEKLVPFTGTNWTNFGSWSYYFATTAEAISDSNGHEECQHRARRYFSVSGAVQTALLNLGISWELYHRAAGDGSVDVYVYLRKPDDSLVQLASHSEDATIDDNSGSLQLCDDLDVADDLDQTGEYAIELWCNITSAWYVPIDEPVYVESRLNWSALPSLEVTERFTKTVLEKVGGGETQKPTANVSSLEHAGLGESYSTIPTGTGTALKFEKAGVQESLEASVAVEKSDSAGLAETLTRTYTYRQHDVPGIPDGAGLAEYLTARWESGNYITERDILGDIDIWEDIDGPETNWESV